MATRQAWLERKFAMALKAMIVPVTLAQNCTFVVR